eukprot:gnl/Dysnectes_brevis/1263_a1414_2686.p1 GENE.gnl/Dysnectes_brevis/1263_a1414_2686~~gnl/Dysnectes_brevis/1263_a1414_2686.p1  ORF type:complete len:1224 (+),score=477.85 gnl/Dysnectes_brevis/1263_a1414_2686:48-3719(+)
MEQKNLSTPKVKKPKDEPFSIGTFTCARSAKKAIGISLSFSAQPQTPKKSVPSTPTKPKPTPVFTSGPVIPKTPVTKTPVFETKTPVVVAPVKKTPVVAEEPKKVKEATPLVHSKTPSRPNLSFSISAPPAKETPQFIMFQDTAPKVEPVNTEEPEPKAEEPKVEPKVEQPMFQDSAPVVEEPKPEAKPTPVFQEAIAEPEKPVEVPAVVEAIANVEVTPSEETPAEETPAEVPETPAEVPAETAEPAEPVDAPVTPVTPARTVAPLEIPAAPTQSPRITPATPAPVGDTPRALPHQDAGKYEGMRVASLTSFIASLGANNKTDVPKRVYSAQAFLSFLEMNEEACHKDPNVDPRQIQVIKSKLEKSAFGAHSYSNRSESQALSAADRASRKTRILGEQTSIALIRQKIARVLNRLTKENMSSCLQELEALYADIEQNAQFDAEQRMDCYKLLVSLLVEKAALEHKFVTLYAKFLSLIGNSDSIFGLLADEKAVQENMANPRFADKWSKADEASKKSLLTRIGNRKLFFMLEKHIQPQFDTFLPSNEAILDDPSLTPEERQYRVILRRVHMFGVIELIGELFVQRIFPPKTMEHCLFQLIRANLDQHLYNRLRRASPEGIEVPEYVTTQHKEISELINNLKKSHPEIIAQHDNDLYALDEEVYAWNYDYMEGAVKMLRKVGPFIFRASGPKGKDVPAGPAGKRERAVQTVRGSVEKLKNLIPTTHPSRIRWMIRDLVTDYDEDFKNVEIKVGFATRAEVSEAYQKEEREKRAKSRRSRSAMGRHGGHGGRGSRGSSRERSSSKTDWHKASSDRGGKKKFGGRAPTRHTAAPPARLNAFAALSAPSPLPAAPQPEPLAFVAPDSSVLKLVLQEALEGGLLMALCTHLNIECEQTEDDVLVDFSQYEHWPELFAALLPLVMNTDLPYLVSPVVKDLPYIVKTRIRDVPTRENTRRQLAIAAREVLKCYSPKIEQACRTVLVPLIRRQAIPLDLFLSVLAEDTPQEAWTAIKAILESAGKLAGEDETVEESMLAMFPDSQDKMTKTILQIPRLHPDPAARMPDSSEGLCALYELFHSLEVPGIITPVLDAQLIRTTGRKEYVEGDLNLFVEQHPFMTAMDDISEVLIRACLSAPNDIHIQLLAEVGPIITQREDTVFTVATEVLRQWGKGGYVEHLLMSLWKDIVEANIFTKENVSAWVASCGGFSPMNRRVRKNTTLSKWLKESE